MDAKYYDVITIKGKGGCTKPKTPSILRGAMSSKFDQGQSQYHINAITQSHAKFVLKGPAPSTFDPEPPKEKFVASITNKTMKLVISFTTYNYNILEQLQKPMPRSPFMNLDS